MRGLVDNLNVNTSPITAKFGTISATLPKPLLKNKLHENLHLTSIILLAGAAAYFPYH